MNTRRIPLLLASLLLAACSNVVITGGGSGESSSVDGTIAMSSTGSTGGTGGSGVGGSAGTGPVQPTLPAVALTRAQDAILWDQWESTHNQSGSSVGVGGGPVLDPNDLFLHISDVGVSCGASIADLHCGGHWDLTLVLTAPIQQVGVYDFDDPELSKYSAFIEDDEPIGGSSVDCAGGGGSPDGGTLEILSITPTEVHFKLTNQGSAWPPFPSAEYTAPRCP